MSYAAAFQQVGGMGALLMKHSPRYFLWSFLRTNLCICFLGVFLELIGDSLMDAYLLSITVVFVAKASDGCPQLSLFDPVSSRQNLSSRALHGVARINPVFLGYKKSTPFPDSRA